MNARCVSICILMLGLTGCTATSRPPMPPAIVMPPPQEKVAETRNPGSLYDPDGANLLFADARARRVGDVLLVKVIETTLASNKASTTANKDNTMELGAEAFLGKSQLPLVSGATVGPDAMVSAGSKSEFSGDGETKRESSLMTTVAARVTKVLGGGLLEIVGARETRVNGETQIVVVQGVARDRDIDADNTIKSTSLAEARIELYGDGVLADKQKPGWLGRVLDNVWPF